jgi:hypothetical protein
MFSTAQPSYQLHIPQGVIYKSHMQGKYLGTRSTRRRPDFHVNAFGSSLSWLGDNQQQPFPAIVVADGGEQQQLSLVVSLSFSWKTPAIAPG